MPGHYRPAPYPPKSRRSGRTPKPSVRMAASAKQPQVNRPQPSASANQPQDDQQPDRLAKLETLVNSSSDTVISLKDKLAQFQQDKATVAPPTDNNRTPRDSDILSQLEANTSPAPSTSADNFMASSLHQHIQSILGESEGSSSSTGNNVYNKYSDSLVPLDAGVSNKWKKTQMG